MRKGSWIDGFGIEIVPFEQRPAEDRARFTDGPMYRIKDIFTTRDGSWEVSDVPGGIDAWARDEYWQGAKWDGAGGATHFFVMVLDENGAPMPGKGILFHDGGLVGAWTPSTAVRQAKQDGTENIPLDGYDYVPATGARGRWLATTVGRADVVRFVGLPYGTISNVWGERGAWHVSTFVVLQATTEGTVVPPIDPRPDPEPEPTPTGDIAAALWAIKTELAKLVTHLGAG